MEEEALKRRSVVGSVVGSAVGIECSTRGQLSSKVGEGT
jgi:hypothetical protein